MLGGIVAVSVLLRESNTRGKPVKHILIPLPVCMITNPAKTSLLLMNALIPLFL